MAQEPNGFEIDDQKYPAQREFALAAVPNEIAALVDGIMGFISESGSGTGHEPDIALALQEALANAVVHGAAGDASKIVYCVVGCAPGAGVMIVVRDPGTGFNPQQIANPLSPVGLVAAHGRGVHLIRQLMDDVQFERDGTQIRMSKQ
jgi:anti-sigma regulatory factor (Ser/Thr protein kinase)